jgi:hypothetical protein
MMIKEMAAIPMTTKAAMTMAAVEMIATIIPMAADQHRLKI